MTDERRSLLVVEDDPALQLQMKWAFDSYEVAVASDREEAIAQLRRVEPAVVTLDLGLPPETGGVSEGFRTLEQILELAPDTKVIVVTGQNDSANARRAVALGAHDFFAKPFDAGVVSLIIDRAFRMHDLQLENRRLLAARASGVGGLTTGAPEMLEVCRMIEKVASTDATVLLLGESGTGKELLARALHESSARSKNRFVAINCAAIPDTLLESELFGYERGAFTGANKQTPGRIETANRGTLFLDEIGDLPASLQAKLLRFLQERTVERLGGREEIPGRRAHRLRHAPEPARTDRGRIVPRRPLLPPGRDRRHGTAAARPSGRRRAAGARPRAAVCRRAETRPPRHQRRGA